MISTAVPLTGLPLLLRELVRLLICHLGSMVCVYVHLLSRLGESSPRVTVSRLFNTSVQDLIMDWSILSKEPRCPLLRKELIYVNHIWVSCLRR